MMRSVMIARIVVGVVALLAPLAPALAQQPQDGLVRYWVPPAYADSSITRFTDPNYVVFNRQSKPSAPLLVFLPGTGGRPANTTEFSDVAARQGYRVIGLEYTDIPAVAQLCPRSPDPNCSEKVRRKRIFGEDVTSTIDDRPVESVVNRLTTLLAVLQRDHPADGWSEYMDNGQPKWPRIALSGLSQGAGMAAYVAQRTRVARVILFSSPWDSYGRGRALAPWLTRGPGETPSDVWFAAYHEREPAADLISRAYAALRIPSNHIRVFTLEPAAGAAYHPSVVGNGGTPRAVDGAPAYLDEWRFLLGDMH